jgi:hypothetical protein
MGELEGTDARYGTGLVPRPPLASGACVHSSTEGWTMRRGKSSLISLGNVAVLSILASSAAASGIGVCPPYSKTFGPDAPPGDISTFISEINVRPGGGTLILEPGSYSIAIPSIVGVVCVRSSEEASSARIYGEILVESGAMLTLRSIEIDGAFRRPIAIEVGAGATFFAENSVCRYAHFVNNGTAYSSNFTLDYGGDFEDLAAAENFGTLVWRLGRMESDIGPDGYGGSARSVFRNHGWALLDRVDILPLASYDQFDAYGGPGIENVDGGTLTLSQTTMPEDGGCMWLGDYGSCGSAGGLVNGPGAVVYVTGSTLQGGLENYGGVEIEQSIMAGECAGGPVTDAGYNVFSSTSCAISEPTSVQADPGFLEDSLELNAGSPAIDLIPLELCPETDARGRPRTDGNGDGTVACDAGALEFTGQGIVVQSPPFARDYGLVDLDTDTALYVVLMSSAAFDPADVVVGSVILGDSGAVPRGYSYVDRNGDGVLDLRLRYKLVDVPLDCGEQTLAVSATTLDGQTVGGPLKLEVIGCVL